MAYLLIASQLCCRRSIYFIHVEFIDSYVHLAHKLTLQYVSLRICNPEKLTELYYLSGPSQRLVPGLSPARAAGFSLQSRLLFQTSFFHFVLSFIPVLLEPMLSIYDINDGFVIHS